MRAPHQSEQARQLSASIGIARVLCIVGIVYVHAWTGLVGAEIIKRHGESEAVVNGVASHHNEVPQNGPWGALVGAADAISASRPGARSETLTTYIKRVEDLERIGMSFEGVEKVYAVQAGRELRVLVEPGRVNDDRAFALAREITRRIEDELHYPGQIRVTVIRETRCVEFAK